MCTKSESESGEEVEYDNLEDSSEDAPVRKRIKKAAMSGSMFESTYRSLSVLKVTSLQAHDNHKERLALLDSGAEINVIKNINELTNTITFGQDDRPIDLVSASGDNIQLDGKGKLEDIQSDIYAASTYATNQPISQPTS